MLLLFGAVFVLSLAVQVAHVSFLVCSSLEWEVDSPCDDPRLFEPNWAVDERPLVGSAVQSPMGARAPSVAAAVAAASTSAPPLTGGGLDLPSTDVDSEVIAGMGGPGPASSPARRPASTSAAMGAPQALSLDDAPGSPVKGDGSALVLLASPGVQFGASPARLEPVTPASRSLSRRAPPSFLGRPVVSQSDSSAGGDVAGDGASDRTGDAANDQLPPDLAGFGSVGGSGPRSGLLHATTPLLGMGTAGLGLTVRTGLGPGLAMLDPRPSTATSAGTVRTPFSSQLGDASGPNSPGTPGVRGAAPIRPHDLALLLMNCWDRLLSMSEDSRAVHMLARPLAGPGAVGLYAHVLLRVAFWLLDHLPVDSPRVLRLLVRVHDCTCALLASVAMEPSAAGGVGPGAASSTPAAGAAAAAAASGAAGGGASARARGSGGVAQSFSAGSTPMLVTEVSSGGGASGPVLTAPAVVALPPRKGSSGKVIPSVPRVASFGSSSPFAFLSSVIGTSGGGGTPAGAGTAVVAASGGLDGRDPVRWEDVSVAQWLLYTVWRCHDFLRRMGKHANAQLRASRIKSPLSGTPFFSSGPLVTPAAGPSGAGVAVGTHLLPVFHCAVRSLCNWRVRVFMEMSCRRSLSETTCCCC